MSQNDQPRVVSLGPVVCRGSSSMTATLTVINPKWPRVKRAAGGTIKVFLTVYAVVKACRDLGKMIAEALFCSRKPQTA